MLMLHVILNVSNHLLHVILKAINPTLEILKLRSEPNLMLVHNILRRIKSCVTHHYKLFYTSTKGANLSRLIHPRSIVKSKRCLRR